MSSLQCLRFKFYLVATFALLIFSTSLFYLFTWDRPAPLSDHSVFDLNQVHRPHRHLSNVPPPVDHFSGSRRPLNVSARSRTLGIASHIFVLSLPRRVDRRMTMDALSLALNLDFVYVDGVEATDSSIDEAIDVLRAERHTFRTMALEKNDTAVFQVLDLFVNGERQHTAGGPGTVRPAVPMAPNTLPETVLGSKGVLALEDPLSFSCATPEDPFPAPLTAAELAQLPPWRILSRGMIACWAGHLRIIKTIDEHHLDVAVVLEDDIDMEYDITARLADMWPALPQNGWDVVMLGHCHSNETTHPPLFGATSLYPSFAPKCTHAYAISSTGAKKLARMLSTPGFAYSRALDQAISWLISTGRLRGYSVVPAIIVQSKRTGSDIWRPSPRMRESGQETDVRRQDGDTYHNGKGSRWRDVLIDSTLERLGTIGEPGRT